MGLTPVIDTKLESGIYVPNWTSERADPLLGLDQWAQYFDFGGLTYPFWPRQTLLGQRQEWPDFTFEGYIQGIYKANGVIFTCMLARMMVFSEARLIWQDLNGGRPGELFGNQDLQILEKPWPNGVTGDLLARAIQDADLAGNSFFTRQGGYLRRLRPDWITIIAGSPSEDPADAKSDPFNFAIDTEVIGYMYQPGGPASSRDPIVLLPEEVCHFAPIPDPIFRFRGMSWLTPVIREILGDNAATSHKLKFFENGATVNMVVSLDPNIQREAFNKWVDDFEKSHRGTLNAYKTLYLGGGASVQPVGSTMQQMDFKTVQAYGETRIAAAAGVHPVIAGFSEALQGSSLNAGNFMAARRLFADKTIRPLWRNFAGSMQTLVPPPRTMSRLWYDDRDIPFLREDRKDVAEIQRNQAATIASLVNAGYVPETVIKAVMSEDFSLLKHTGLYSVQLQPPGTSFHSPSANGNGSVPAVPVGAGANGTSAPA